MLVLFAAWLTLILAAFITTLVGLVIDEESVVKVGAISFAALVISALAFGLVVFWIIALGGSV